MADRTALERRCYFLTKGVRQAVREFDLLDAGDRVAVAVSGGKDSRALLELLLEHRRSSPQPYTLTALHVEGTQAGFPDLRLLLEPWFQFLGVAYHFVPLDLPPGEALPMNCFRCAWNRRRALFRACAALDCNKLALGHHADDVAATTLMNLLHAGRLETMLPRQTFFDDAVTIIRPLFWLGERELAHYARLAGYPDLHPCPQGLAGSRAQVKEFLRSLGRGQKRARANLWRAVRQNAGH